MLPLLRDAFVTPGWVSDSTFLAGYGAAQAVPGPLFTFAAYLGAVVGPTPHGIAGAALGLIGIFLPGMLLLVGTLPFWDTLRSRAGAQAAMRGINAAVVGLLGAALYSPLWTSSINTTGDLSVALIGFVIADRVANSAAVGGNHRRARRCRPGSNRLMRTNGIGDQPAVLDRLKLQRAAVLRPLPVQHKPGGRNSERRARDAVR